MADNNCVFVFSLLGFMTCWTVFVLRHNKKKCWCFKQCILMAHNARQLTIIQCLYHTPPHDHYRALFNHLDHISTRPQQSNNNTAINTILTTYSNLVGLHTVNLCIVYRLWHCMCHENFQTMFINLDMHRLRNMKLWYICYGMYMNSCIHHMLLVYTAVNVDIEAEHWGGVAHLPPVRQCMVV